MEAGLGISGSGAAPRKARRAPGGVAGEPRKGMGTVRQGGGGRG